MSVSKKASEQPSPSSSDDLTLVLAAAQAGDSNAVSALYQRFRGVVHGIVLARAGLEHVEDVTQDAFVAICRGLAQVKQAAALPGWICTIARNTATDHLRRRMRVPVTQTFDDTQTAGPPGDDSAELRRRVLALIRTLPSAYRETLVLRLVEGLTGPEIAARTGMTPGSVRVNLTRGMAQLRPLLREEGWP